MLCVRNLILVMACLMGTFVSAEEQYAHNFVIVSMFKDEAKWLEEWIVYHEMLGAEKFYLIDNASSDQPRKVLEPYIRRGLVELIYNYKKAGMNGQHIAHMQRESWTQCLREAARDRCKWVALMDVDEFLLPLEMNSITEVLDYYDRPTIGVLWIYPLDFGPSGFQSLGPDQLQTECLLKHCGRMLVWPKSIVRPERFNKELMPMCVHRNYPRKGYQLVEVPDTLMRINHYRYRSYDWIVTKKLQRLLNWNMRGIKEALQKHTPQEVARQLDWKHQVVDERSFHMERFVAPLKERLLDQRRQRENAPLGTGRTP